MVSRADWSDIKQFKDPVYGYIPISRAYVKNLIDTQMMQRIKGVAQTGLRPVFSSATHDRFSHSLGVYKFGMEMYKSLEEKLKTYIIDVCFPRWKLEKEQEENVLKHLKKALRHWKTLLAIACLLHDIGHPVQSHGFEFLYDDPYLDVDYKEYDQPEAINIYDELDCKERERVYKQFIKLAHTGEKTPEGNLHSKLLEEFQKHDKKSKQASSIPGGPHERMSAYYILIDTQLRKSVKALIMSDLHPEIGEINEDEINEDEKEEINQDICFIARMIIGWEYPVEEQLSFQEDTFFDSIKNCVIHILNGTIDADGIDYLMRNSYAAGYDTSKIDSARLCNAYTAYEKHFVMFPAFSKSALSVLEGYMSARNFEPKWLYSHHKVVYADLVTKRLYKYITRYLTERTMLCQSVKLFLRYASQSAIVNEKDQDFGYDLLLLPDEKGKRANKSVSLGMNELHSHIENWSYPFYTYLLAPCRSYTICSHNFSRTADADLDTLFHWIHNELAEYKNVDLEVDYEKYKDQLIKNVSIGLRDDPFVSGHVKELRILLAEYCLGSISADHEKDDAREVLKRWAETGCNEELETYSASKKPGQVFSLITGMLTRIKDGCSQNLLEYWLQQYQPLLTKADFIDFSSLLDEYHTRRYRKSLWKSWPEYQLFLKDCSKELGVSPDDVHQYMSTLITEGMREHGFSIFDGKAVKYPPILYQEQFFYQYQDELQEETIKAFAEFQEERNKGTEKKAELAEQAYSKTPERLNIGKQIVQKWAGILFSKTSNYDFSQTKLAVKFYRIKTKRFNKIHLLFNNYRAVPLEEVFPQIKSNDEMFPYLYYNGNTDKSLDGILKAFQKQFIEFCREYRESEVRSDIVKMGKNPVFRDAIYGDIEVPEKFYAVICTREFQRLGRIRQLATADRRFPDATHTRLAHSIGTWYVMGQILNHFQQLYETNKQLYFSEQEKNDALLAALLHDLGHGPYSHAAEKVFGLNHENWTLKIIGDTDTEIHNVIEERFGIGTADRVCKLLKGKSFAESASGISLIYHTMISGQLDADRIDYLMRDNAACGMSFGHIDFQQLIASMRMLPDYDIEEGNTVYRLCFDDRYLSAIDQFIYARYQMYKNVYHDPKKLLFEHIFERIFHEAFDLLDAIEQDKVFSTLKKIKIGGSELTVSEYIELDDEALNMLIKKWANGAVLKEDFSNVKELINRAKTIELLSQAFLNQHHLFEQVDLGAKKRQYDILERRIGKHLNKQDCFFRNKESCLDQTCCAFIYIQGSSFAYEMNKEDEKKNIILRNLDDGTTDDYIQRSMFRSSFGTTDNTILKTDYYYLFFSKKLLEIYFSDDIVNRIKKIVDSAKPRKHIEIETKFYCKEEHLENAKAYLKKLNKAPEPSIKNQEDTYFDCISGGTWILFDEQFSFRRRKIEEKYIFTVKIPTTSPNYHSPSQFARHEYELESEEESITDEVWQFLIDTLDSCGKSEVSEKLSKEKMKERLIVCNHRITYRLEGKCEICLDTVDYKAPDGKEIGKQDYQIEIELLDEPENWLELEKRIIEPLVKELGEGSLISTNKSKFERGISYLYNT